MLRRFGCVLVWFCSLSLGLFTAALAQDEDELDPPAKPSKPEVAADPAAVAAAKAKAAEELARAQAEALAELTAGSAELTVEQRKRFEQWLPHTLKRLERRAPVHIVVLGDSVTRYMSYDDNRENSHFAYHGVFAALLADEFFYTGGVRDVQPTSAHEPKLEPLLGPEITLENLGMNGRVSLHALSRITTDGLVNRPDLVMINFGINDALTGIGLATYVEAIGRSTEMVKATGADVILLGPNTTIRDTSPGELALTRAYSAAMEEVAARLGVFYFDLGSVTTTTAGVPGKTDPAGLLAAVVSSYRERYWDHGPENLDGLHPSPAAHQRMGQAIFAALRGEPVPPPYRLGGFFTLDGEGKVTLEVKMKNQQEVPAKGQILLLPAAGMEPESAGLPFDLAAGKAQVFRVSYQAAGGAGLDFPADSPRVFVPLIVADAIRTYSPVITAPVTPVGVVWDTGNEDLQGGSSFAINCSLVATTTAAASGTFDARWNGQSSTGRFEVQPGGQQPIALRFDLPLAGGQFSLRDQLVLSLTIGGKVSRFVRNLEVSRNLGLGERVPMMHPESYAKGERASDGRVQFVAEADASQLVLNFDVDGIGLEGDDSLTPLILEFQLDARGQGKRRTFGYVDVVRVKFAADGSAERLGSLRPAVFGDWYDRALDNDALTASRRFLPDGRARYSVAIPRSYLYLHEFALGSGDSVFGVNAELMFAKAGQPDNPYPAERHFALVGSGLSKFCAESLTLLELSARPSGRWSRRLD